MRIAFLAAVAALSLASGAVTGCTTLDKVTVKVDQTNGKIQSGLTEACPKVEPAHTAFVLATWFVNVPKSVVTAEAAAYATAKKYCADPSTVTVQNAPQLVLDALDAIKDAKVKADAAS